jgi:DMSO/TMAO reductase YedYZ molybdopterin-dependent catalytic subunit
MNEPLISRGFSGKRRGDAPEGRVPPGQYVTHDFPVLSAGPTPRTPISEWSLSLKGLLREPIQWTWNSFVLLPAQEFVVDIHCVTKWPKLDTKWWGVSIDTLLEHAQLSPEAQHVLIHCDGGYTTNLPLRDLTGGKAFIATQYDEALLAPEHGGPARLVVPHLYFWKSAKWVRSLEFSLSNQPGLWESLGYHNYGDPWKEQRYRGIDKTYS